jgi:polyferredoxin
MSLLKTSILAGFIAGSLFVHRPWCRIFCPLGGFLALFNRVSLFHLRFQAQDCVECNLCRTHRATGVEVERRVNTAGCVRCLECTTCGALEPALALPDATTPPTKSQGTAQGAGLDLPR